MNFRAVTLPERPDPAELAAASPLLAGPLAEAWTRNRHPYRPELLVADDGALLVTHRPRTAQRKVAASAWRPGAGAAVVAALVERMRESGIARLVWEAPGPDAGGPAHPDDVDEVLEAAGFRRLRAPYASAPGTTGVAGWALELVPLPHDEPPFYAQTTDFTCGAVTGLLVANLLDADAGLTGRDRAVDRATELAFWRRATNFPAVDPLGLLVELARELPAEAALDAWISVDGPTLVEGVEPGFELETKELLQRESAREASELGLPVRREWLSMERLRERVAEGARAIVLVDLVPMHDDPTPHWVLLHAVGDDVVLVQDPWLNAERGETWLDGHDLAIADDDFSAMARWGDPAYRAVVLVERR